jgi:transcriptional regulator with XRE-family HTH domain
MADRMSETEEKLAFINRVKQARKQRFETQKPICTILEIDQGTYKQYETRTALPHRYIPKFCAATGVSIEWLLTGEGQGPPQPEYPKLIRSKKIAQRKAA